MGFVQRRPERPVIDLQGPNGNAFYLLAIARGLAKELGFDKDEIKELTKEMKSSDYKNLVKVFDRAFGDHVDLILPDNWSWDNHVPEDQVNKSFVVPVVKIGPK